MKRGKKLVTLLVVLAVVMAATYAATLINPENQEEETEYTTIFTVDAEAVTALRWDYSEDVAFVRENGEWVYEADPVFPLDESYLDTMLESLKEVKSSKTIEKVEDWDQYTLEAPICEIVLTAEGENHTIKIGEETSMGGERYLSIGDSNAYLVDAEILDAFRYGLYDVMQWESVPNMSDLYSLEVNSDVQNYEILNLPNSGLAYSDDYVWFLGEKALDTQLTNSLVSNVKNLSWESCADYYAEDPANYGLAVPAATVTAKYVETVQVDTGETDENGEAIYETEARDASFVLEIGSQVGESCYARIAGSDMVYKIDAALVETLLYTTYYELQPDEVLLMDWEEVQSMDVTLDGEVYTITKDVKTVTDDEGNSSEETVWLLKGEEVAADSITDALDALDSTGYANGQTPERTEEVRILIHRDHAAFPEVELVFYQYDSSQCLTTLNGEATVFADRTQVVELVEAIHKIVL